MARGFESKDVEFQQAEAERRRSPRQALGEADRARAERRQTVQLSLAKLRGDLEAATAPAHRRMLEEAVATLERELVTLSD
jgi:hypothetical protein